MQVQSRTNDSTPYRLTGSTGVVYRGFLGGSVTGLAFAVFLAIYLATSDRLLVDPGTIGYPLVWLVVSVGAISAVGRPRSPFGIGPLAVGIGYIVGLLMLSGHLRLGRTAFTVGSQWGLPGWGPIITVDLLVVSLIVVPFQLIGYATLGYLLARSLTIWSRSAVVGLAGIFTCAGCLVPVAVLLASVGGVSTSIGYGVSYLVATIVFVSTALVFVAVIGWKDASQAT